MTSWIIIFINFNIFTNQRAKKKLYALAYLLNHFESGAIKTP